MGLGVSATVGLFESIVAQLPVIMCFQSLILDMAGNVGTQSLAVAIRVLMDKQLSGKQKLALIIKESRVGLTNGLILGALSFLIIGGYLVLKGNTVPFAFAVSGCLGTAMYLPCLSLLYPVQSFLFSSRNRSGSGSSIRPTYHNGKRSGGRHFLLWIVLDYFNQYYAASIGKT